MLNASAEDAICNGRRAQIRYEQNNREHIPEPTQHTKRKKSARTRQS